MTIDFNVTGGPAGWNFGKSYSVISPSDLAFDAFSLYYVGGSFSIDNLVITHTAAAAAAAPSNSGSGFSAFDLGGPTVIPEPSTYAAGTGLAALGLAFWRRRRAAAKAAVA